MAEQRRRLPDLPPQLRRRERRRHRRPGRHPAAAALPGRPRRRRRLAQPLVRLPDGRRRLRHRGPPPVVPARPRRRTRLTPKGPLPLPSGPRRRRRAPAHRPVLPLRRPRLDQGPRRRVVPAPLRPRTARLPATQATSPGPTRTACTRYTAPGGPSPTPTKASGSSSGSRYGRADTRHRWDPVTEGVPVDLGRGTRRAPGPPPCSHSPSRGAPTSTRARNWAWPRSRTSPPACSRTRGGPGPAAPTGAATDAAYPSWPADRFPRTERCRERPLCGSAPPEVRAPQEPAPGVGARGPAPPPSKETR